MKPDGTVVKSIEDLITTEQAELPLSSVRPYRTWTALLKQDGSSVPTAVVLENTLNGDVLIARYGVGGYQLNLPYNIQLEKIFMLGQTVYDSGAYTVSMPLTGFSSTIEGVVIFYANHIDGIVTDQIAIDIYDSSNAQVEMSSMISLLPIEIRVYN